MIDDLTPIPVSHRKGYDGSEWYTPTEYIEAAREVMGRIVLDPASCELAQTVVKANFYWTKTEDGLNQNWCANTIFLNPPYGKTADWVRKALAEYSREIHIAQMIVLVNNATETDWFQSLLNASNLVCLPSRRLAFWRHDQQGVTARQGQAIFYLGPNIRRFVEVFKQFGPIVSCIEDKQP